MIYWLVYIKYEKKKKAKKKEEKKKRIIREVYQNMSCGGNTKTSTLFKVKANIVHNLIG